jgi:NAD(P)-dependent dehydrogenase (short-subunit alcohol dehydrogenase family)
MSIEGKVVCVAGATGYLGSVVAAMSVKAGARVVLLGQSEERLGALRSDLCLKDSRCLAFSVDAGDSHAVSQIMEVVVKQMGRIDVLFNTVGGYQGAAPLWETPDEVWQAMWRLNVVSCVNLNRAVLPPMLAGKWGRVVNIAAKTALEPRKNGAAYAAAKAAVIALTQTLALELKGTGVTSNVILPSVIDSPTNRESMPGVDPNRWVRPAQIAATMLFLCSDEAAAINGAAMPVYGQI